MLDRITIFCLTILLAGSIVMAMSIGTAAPPAERKETTFLEHLTPGRAVSLTEKDGRYEVGLFPENFRPLGHKVIEIGPNYVVLRDFVGITDTIVPIYSLKAIKVLRVGGRQQADVLIP